MSRHMVAKGPRDTVKSSMPSMRASEFNWMCTATASHNTGNISSDSKETIDNQPVKTLSTQLEFVGERLWVLFTNTKSGFQRERGSRGKGGMWTKRSKLNMKWTKHYQGDKYKYEWIMQSVIYEEMSVVLACNFPRKTCARHQFSPDIDLCFFLEKIIKYQYNSDINLRLFKILSCNII